MDPLEAVPAALALEGGSLEVGSLHIVQTSGVVDLEMVRASPYPGSNSGLLVEDHVERVRVDWVFAARAVALGPRSPDVAWSHGVSSGQ